MNRSILVNERDKLVFLLIIGLSLLMLGGCTNEVGSEVAVSPSEVSPAVAEQPEPTPGGPERLVGQVRAVEERLDRADPEWLMDYCVERVEELAVLPTSYERMRGPLRSMNPVKRVGRYTQASEAATCNLDYYIWPKREEAFADMGLEHVYAESRWQEFEEAVVASVAAELTDEGWEQMEDEREGVRADLMLSHWLPEERMSEYLDMFVTNDEEVVFELLVVAEEL